MMRAILQINLISHYSAASEDTKLFGDVWKVAQDLNNDQFKFKSWVVHYDVSLVVITTRILKKEYSF